MKNGRNPLPLLAKVARGGGTSWSCSAGPSASLGEDQELRPRGEILGDPRNGRVEGPRLLSTRYRPLTTVIFQRSQPPHSGTRLRLMMTQNWWEVNSLIPQLFQWISSGPQKTPALAS